MMKTSVIALILLLLVGFCSRKPDSVKPMTMTEEERQDYKEATAPPIPIEDQNRPIISRVEFSPAEMTVQTDISIKPTLQRDEPGVTYKCRWFINEKEQLDLDALTLPHDRFHKKDVVHCIIKAKNGNVESPELHSDFRIILNSDPAIEPLPLTPFRLPGELSYQIKASDPDGDSLTYDLLSPLDMGVVVDRGSGKIIWAVDASMLRSLPKSLEIRFKVSDQDGGQAEGFITMNLSGIQ